MISEYPNLKICYSPEFLRERFAYSDFISTKSVLVVGTHDDYMFETIKNCFRSIPEHMIKTTPTEAELIKYFMNNYAAVRVVFANIFYELCCKLGANYDIVKNTYLLTGRDQGYLEASPELRGYAGPCLPKDMLAMIHLIKKLGLNFDLFKATHDDNTKFKPTVFDGMRR